MNYSLSLRNKQKHEESVRERVPAPLHPWGGSSPHRWQYSGWKWYWVL